ncbi:MAG TPA: hypothetical protein VM344_00290 [Vitreimonas sp.]|nr:hypothetical protein [Vitreimonas sp.]
MTIPGRDGIEVEALRTDRYVEALLASVDRRGDDAPADAALEPEVRDAARRLARDLVRVHPSFRFEERLAARLEAVARGTRLVPAAGGETLSIGLRPAVAGALAQATPPAGSPHPDAPDLRPYLIGGAITSAALSLAGAAWVAWRWARPPARSPMARAVRAARQARGPRVLS